MNRGVVYTRRERFWLWTLAAFGFFGVNGAFVYGLLEPGALQEAIANPLALAFMGEALVLMGAMAYLLAKWGVSVRPWPWFIFLSFLGSLLFALPVVLLWAPRSGRTRGR